MKIIWSHFWDSEDALFDSLYKIKSCDMYPVSVSKSLLHLFLVVQSII